MGNILDSNAPTANPTSSNNPQQNKGNTGGQYQLVETQHIEGVGLVRVMTTKFSSENLIAEVDLYDKVKDIDQRLIEQRLRINKHQNLLSSLGIDNISSETRQLTNQSKFYFEFCQLTVDSLINERIGSNQLFPEEQIIEMVQGVASALGYLQERGIPHGDIQPGTVYYDTRSALFQIYDRDLWAGRTSGIACALQKKKVPYLSPEAIVVMREGRSVLIDEHAYQSDIFSLGMIMLEMACLKKSADCYDDCYTILAPIINQRIQFIGNFYTNNFVNLLKIMLDYDVNTRLDSIALWTTLIQLTNRNTIPPVQHSQQSQPLQHGAPPQKSGFVQQSQTIPPQYPQISKQNVAPQSQPPLNYPQSQIPNSQNQSLYYPPQQPTSNPSIQPQIVPMQNQGAPLYVQPNSNGISQNFDPEVNPNPRFIVRHIISGPPPTDGEALIFPQNQIPSNQNQSIQYGYNPNSQFINPSNQKGVPPSPNRNISQMVLENSNLYPNNTYAPPVNPNQQYYQNQVSQPQQPLQPQSLLNPQLTASPPQVRYYNQQQQQAPQQQPPLSQPNINPNVNQVYYQDQYGNIIQKSQVPLQAPNPPQNQQIPQQQLLQQQQPQPQQQVYDGKFNLQQIQAEIQQSKQMIENYQQNFDPSTENDGRRVGRAPSPQRYMHVAETHPPSYVDYQMPQQKPPMAPTTVLPQQPIRNAPSYQGNPYQSQGNQYYPQPQSQNNSINLQDRIKQVIARSQNIRESLGD